MLAALLLALQDEYRPYVAPASDEGERRIGSFQVPEGFEVKLWAAEPQLANPVAMYVTNAGEVFVAETFRIKSGVDDIRDHMDWLDDDLACRTVEDRVAYLTRHLGDKFESTYTKDRERLRWIGDTDGDGRADKDAVFADHFNTPADGIAAGVLEHRGRVYFACMPTLWDLADTDGDHVADAKRVLSSGYGVRFALIGHDLHGLRIGPDGKLYFSCGDRGLSVPLADGSRLQNQFNGAVLRCNLDGSELEIFATGLRNPQELVFDEYGELWTVDNNSDGGDQARLVHVIEGMDAGWRQAYQWLVEPNLRGPWNDEGLWKPHFEGQAAYIVPPLANICDGPSGLTYNPGTALGGQYANHFFLCDFRGGPSYSGIQTFTVKPKGASFELEKLEKFVWGTLATDCDFGPDGALWWSDWVEGWNKTGKGRVYRLEPKTPHAEAAEVAQLLRADWSPFNDAKVRSAMGSGDQRVRFLAQFELVSRGKKQLLLRLAEDPTATKLARLHALWGLGSMEFSDSIGEALARVGDDEDAVLRANALRALANHQPWRFNEVVHKRIDDPEPLVRRYALAAFPSMGWKTIKSADARFVALARTTGESDPALRATLIRVLALSATPEQLALLAHSDSVDVRVASVVALRRMHSPELASFLGDEAQRVVVEAARAIYDEQIAGAMPALAAMISREQPLESTALVRRVLNANFRLGTRENAEALMKFAERSSNDELHRWEALDLLAKWTEPPGRDGFTGEWWPLPKREAPYLPALVEELRIAGIENAPKRIALAWIALAERCNASIVGPALVARARDAATDGSIRAAAIRAAKKIAPGTLEPALDVLVTDKSSSVRAAALRAISGLAPERAFPLLEEAALHGSTDERRVAYSTLAPLADPRIDALLAGELARHGAGLVPREVALDLVEAAEQRSSPAVKSALAALHELRALDAPLAPFADSLYGGDRERGKKVLRTKAETECLRCHRIEWGEGGQVGPDLVGVGSRLSRVDLLASICEPNRRIAEGYQGTVLFTDTKTFAGIVVSETAETIVLRTAQDELVEVDAADVEQRKPDLSAMPQDVSKSLSRAEMRDLIEYLANL